MFVARLKLKVKKPNFKPSTLAGIRAILILALLPLLSVFLVSSLGSRKVAAAGNFTTQNGKIYDPDGKEFIPIGNNEWGPAVGNLGGYDSNVTDKANIYADVLKFNTIRLGVCASGDTCYDDPGQGNSYSATPVSEQTLQKLDSIINAFTAKKVVVILANFEFNGCHGFSDQWVYKVHNLNKAYAQRYKNNPYVWINILNEPKQDPNGITATQWDTLTNTGIDTIRGEGNQNIIVIDGPTECSSEDIAETSFSSNNSRLYSQASSIISRAGGNVVADVHTYYLGASFKNVTTDEAGQRLADFAAKLRNDKSMPLILGEFPPAIDETRTFLAFQWQGVDYYMKYGDLNKAVYKAATTANLGVLSWAPAGGSESEMYLLFPSRQWWNINKTDGTKPTNLTYGGNIMWDLSHDQNYMNGSGTTPTDTTPPTIHSVTNNGSDPAHDTIIITANITDETLMSKAELYVDDQLKQTRTKAQASGDDYSFTFDTKTLTNGSHTFKVKAYDTSNNTKESSSTTITVDNPTTTTDTTPPTFQAFTTSNGSNPAQGTIQAIVQNVSDDVAIKNVKLYIDDQLKETKLPADATNNSYTFDIDTKTLSNGDHTIKAIISDTSDNLTTTQVITTTINNSTTTTDTTPPTIGSTEPAAGSSSNATGQFTIKANNVTDDTAVTSVVYKVDGNTQEYPLTLKTTNNYEATISTTDLSNGTHTITIVAKDAAGNISAVKTFTINVNNSSTTTDTTPPTIGSTEPAAGSTTTVNGKITIKANNVADDTAVTSVVYKVDGNTQEYPLTLKTTNNYEATISTTDLSNGTHTITIVAKDAAGNISAVKTFTINVNNSSTTTDTTPPTIGSTEPAAGSTTTVNGKITIKANNVADDTAIASVSYRIDNGAQKYPLTIAVAKSSKSIVYAAGTSNNYTASLDTTTLSNADHTITIQALDTSNNTSNVSTFTIKVNNSSSNNNNNGNGSNSNNSVDQGSSKSSVIFPPQTGVNIVGASLQQTDYYIDDQFIGSRIGQENLNPGDVIMAASKLKPGEYILKSIGKYTDGTTNTTTKVVKVFAQSFIKRHPILTASTTLTAITLAGVGAYVLRGRRASSSGE